VLCITYLLYIRCGKVSLIVVFSYCVLFECVVTLYVLLVCCVLLLYYCQRAKTQLLLNNNNNIKMDLREREDEVVWTGLMWLRIGTSGGLL
jgi:hypothetical protein